MAQSRIQVADAVAEIKLTFFADATTATYVLEATHAGSLVAKQKSSLKL